MDKPIDLTCDEWPYAVEAMLKYMCTGRIEPGRNPSEKGFTCKETYYARLHYLAEYYEIPTLARDTLDMFNALTLSLAQAKRNDRTALSTWFYGLIGFVYDENQFPGSDSPLKTEVLELVIDLKSLSTAADEEDRKNVLMAALQYSPKFGRDLYIWETLGDREKHDYS